MSNLGSALRFHSCAAVKAKNAKYAFALDPGRGYDTKWKHKQWMLCFRKKNTIAEHFTLKLDLGIWVGHISLILVRI